jgi:hypothetical protein
MYKVIDQSDVQHVILDFVFAWVVCICGPWDKKKYDLNEKHNFQCNLSLL